MKRSHEHRSARVAEPVQVYLAPAERARLDRLAAHLDASKSDVIRSALEALERATLDPLQHPAAQLIGIADATGATPAPYDIAREHDRYLAESEIASWRDRKTIKRKGRGR